MEIIKIENLTFKYPLKDKKALNNINLSVNSGDFIVICGKSGCGKSTLLKHLKPTLTPHGEVLGNIYYEGQDIIEIDSRVQASELGFVHQSPENQIVTDKVWHELAFGLENLGYDNEIIRLRVAEMASYFGIEKWFFKEVSELSGGEKQILNLASIMAMSPKVLILDEPTSQLDPILAAEFLDTIKKINMDLGITVILSEHRLDTIFPMADRVVVMEHGNIIIDATPKKVGEFLRDNKNDMFLAVPSPMRIYTKINNNLECPITVRDGRRWLDKLLSNSEIVITENEEIKEEPLGDQVIELKEVWFKYEKNGSYILKDLSLKVHKGELYSIVGGNGTGKTTTLNLISGINKAYRGKVFIHGKEIGKYLSKELFNNNLGVLPQNPQSIFTMKTVREDLMEMLFDIDIKEDEKKQRVSKIVETLDIEDILDMHPYDLSGGEQQKAALAKILLLEPKILLLDEPTKALDSFYKEKLGVFLKKLKRDGITIIMVTHDIEFAAQVSDTCGMFFDGSIITSGSPKKFFSNNNFYTTSANKMSRDIFKAAITCEDVIKLCKKNL
ncbi:ABC transporter ATP-binding protein [Clostridium vincentii]|uniref:Putative HMP/thiamine import ATP-binding protein YkoD n=1 Tax=Clostridium vincentii TaxID=52704 RepID=A0A2T0BHM8_9CLOT|nr:ABC transporter ATP-binding protein [Clostridium vincentii]PRR83400.1 putative HMP/thiamine import ATP-binding protein YkoD [Clostridium vincentii]